MEYKKEKTLIIIKPDGIQRSLVGNIIQRLELVGLKIVALKMVVPTPEQIEKHYTLNPEWKRTVGQKSIEGYKKKGMEPPSYDPEEVGDAVVDRLKKYMTGGPVIVMVWQGAHSVALVRKLVGGTEPHTSEVGTIRGDFVLDSYQLADSDDRAMRNLIHASGSIEEAEDEINHWFASNELISYRIIQEHILYDVNLDGILE